MEVKRLQTNEASVRGLRNREKEEKKTVSERESRWGSSEKPTFSHS